MNQPTELNHKKRSHSEVSTFKVLAKDQLSQITCIYPLLQSSADILTMTYETLRSAAGCQLFPHGPLGEPFGVLTKVRMYINANDFLHTMYTGNGFIIQEGILRKVFRSLLNGPVADRLSKYFDCRKDVGL